MSFEAQMAVAVRTLQAWCAVLSLALLVALALAIYGLVQVSNDQQANTSALCSLRADVQQRASSGQNFLNAHPHGIPGISAGEIRVSLSNEQATLHALRSLAGHCRH